MTTEPTLEEVLIEPDRRRALVDLGELLRYRDLLYFLSWRNLAARYKQTLFGVMWALIQPLAMSGIFTVFFGIFSKLPSDGQPAFLFMFCGMLPWNFIRNAVAQASDSLVANRDLIAKVFFPRLLVPVSAIAVAAVDFVIALAAFLLILTLGYGKLPGAAALLLPVVALSMLAASVGISLLASAVNVRFRDMRYAIPFLLQCWLFCTPILYPVSVMGEYGWLMSFNPAAGPVETFRACMLGLPVPWTLLGGSAATSLVLLLVGLHAFRRMERFFADIV